MQGTTRTRLLPLRAPRPLLALPLALLPREPPPPPSRLRLRQSRRLKLTCSRSTMRRNSRHRLRSSLRRWRLRRVPTLMVRCLSALLLLFSGASRILTPFSRLLQMTSTTSSLPPRLQRPRRSSPLPLLTSPLPPRPSPTKTFSTSSTLKPLRVRRPASPLLPPPSTPTLLPLSPSRNLFKPVLRLRLSRPSPLLLPPLPPKPNPPTIFPTCLVLSAALPPPPLPRVRAVGRPWLRSRRRRGRISCSTSEEVRNPQRRAVAMDGTACFRGASLRCRGLLMRTGWSSAYFFSFLLLHYLPFCVVR
jgi:hypothetical protein